MLVDKSRIILPTYVYKGESNWNSIYQDIQHIHIIHTLNNEVPDKVKSLLRNYTIIQEYYFDKNKTGNNIPKLDNLYETMRITFRNELSCSYRYGTWKTMSKIMHNKAKYRSMGDDENLKLLKKDYKELVILNNLFKRYIARFIYEDLMNKYKLNISVFKSKESISKIAISSMILYGNKSKDLREGIIETIDNLDIKEYIEDLISSKYDIINYTNNSGCSSYGYKGKCEETIKCKCYSTLALEIMDLCESISSYLSDGLTIQ